MNKLKGLKRRLKYLKIILVVFPFIYGLIIAFLKRYSKKAKAIIIIFSIASLIFYLLVIGDFFKTKREIQKLDVIELKLIKKR